jgi:hypothetical protein
VSKATVLAGASVLMTTRDQNIMYKCLPGITSRVALPTLAPQQELSATIAIEELSKVMDRRCSEFEGLLTAKVVDQGDSDVMDLGNFVYRVH